MFPDENETETRIYMDEEVIQQTEIKSDDELTVKFNDTEQSLVVGGTFVSPYYFFKDKFDNKTLLSSTILPYYIDSFQEYELHLDIYLDIDSTYLLGFKTTKLITWLEDFHSQTTYLVDELNDETGVLIKYHTSLTLYRVRASYENAVINYSMIELVLLPGYILLGLVLWVLLKEGFMDLKHELQLFLTRGAKKSQFVKHYSMIFVVSDVTIVLLFAGIGELISQLSYQISSFSMSLVGGILTLIPLEFLKIYFLHAFASTHIKAFTQEHIKKSIKVDKKDLSFRQMFSLLGLGAFFLLYSIILPRILPSEFISIYILISRIIAGFLFLIAITLFSLRMSLNTSISLLNKISKKAFAVTKFIESLFLAKRRNFRLFTLVSFWLIIASSFTLNAIELNKKSDQLLSQAKYLDVELYTKGIDLVNLSAVLSILSDEDVENYIPITEGREVWDHYERIYFLPILNITDACPSFFRLENARGEKFDFQAMAQTNHSLLVSHNVIERKGYEIGDNISINLHFNPSFDPDTLNFPIPETFSMANYTIFDEFNYFPFTNYYEWIDRIQPHYNYVADYSLLKTWFGELVFSSVLIDLKKNVDPVQWSERIRAEWGALEEDIGLYVPGEMPSDIVFVEPIIFDDIAIIEVFMLSAVIIGFTLFYFQSMIRHSKTQILIALSRGMDRKQLQRSLVLSTSCLILINIILSFLVGISFSAIFHFGLHPLELKVYNLIPITLSSVIFFFVIFGVSICSTLVSYVFIRKQIDTAALSQMGPTILGEYNVE